VPKPAPLSKSPAGDHHWNDANLRSQHVANELARRAPRRPDNPIPKLSKRDRNDLAAYEHSNAIVRDGINAVRTEKQRKATARKRAQAQAGEHQHKGFGGFVHKTLDLASNAPIVGGAAGVADAGLYLAEGDTDRAIVAAAGAAGGAVPIPLVGKRLGKYAGKKVAKLVSKHKPSKAGMPKFGGSVQTKAQQKASLERLERIKKQRARREAQERADRFERRGGKIWSDIVGNKTTGEGAKSGAEKFTGDED
jgi:hypothetical protein